MDLATHPPAANEPVSVPPEYLPMTQNAYVDAGAAPRGVPVDPFRVLSEGGTRRITAEESVVIALDHNQYIDVLRYRQPLWGTRVDEALAPFDPIVELGQQFTEANSPLTSNVTAAGTNVSSQLSQRMDPPSEQNDNISYSRRTSDGSVVGLNYSNRYERLVPGGNFRVVNPAWNSGVSLTIRKPLLRGAGVDANMAKANINRQFYQRAGWDVQQAMNYLARTVRRAYWDLDLAYRFLDIQTRSRTWVEDACAREQKKFELGTGTIADVAQSKEMLERFRILEFDAKASLLEQERKFRWMLGIREFGDRVFLTELNSQPIMAIVDWERALDQAIRTRPDLAAQRSHIEAYRHEIGLRKNETLPDFSLLGRVGVSGLDQQLGASVDDMLGAEGTNWMAGLVYRRPVNNVLADSLLRRAALNMAQQEAVLEQLTHNATHDLRQAYITVAATRRRREMQQARVEAAKSRLDASEKQYKSRKLAQVDYLLRAREAFTAAELARARSIIEERKSIEQWNYERGAILCDGAFEEVAGLVQP